MIVQVERVVSVYEGECQPKYRYWHQFVSADGAVYYLVGPQPLELNPQQLLNIERYPQSWVRRYHDRWGLDEDSNYVKEIK